MKRMFSNGEQKKQNNSEKIDFEELSSTGIRRPCESPFFRSPRDSVGQQRRSMMWKRGFRKLLASWARSNTHAECKMKRHRRRRNRWRFGEGRLERHNGGHQ
jgi:hypothetical protein